MSRNSLGRYITLLAPDIINVILDGKQGPEVTLARVLEPFPLEWNAQQEFQIEQRKRDQSPAHSK